MALASPLVGLSFVTVITALPSEVCPENINKQKVILKLKKLPSRLEVITFSFQAR